MNNNYYKSPQATKLMRLFWKACGADSYLLERSTYSDQIKYYCLGGIVVATGVMASLAGGYAFYTIFSSKNPETGDMLFSLSDAMISCVFGIVWGLIIFNIDRFIVASTGKGDGTEAITKQEIVGAIPRIIMGIVIALTISKPIEIRMFQTEIQAELYKEKKEKLRKDKSIVEANYKNKLEELDKDITSLEKKISDKEKVYNQRQSEWDAFTKTGNDAPKHFAIAMDAKAIWLRTERIYRPQINNKLEEVNNQIKDRDREIAQTKDNANSLNGLALRIRLAEKVAGPWISLFITLLFMVIELTPIFFKMMLIKGPYDYMDENVRELARAEAGIEIEYDFYLDKNGMEKHKIINHAAELKLKERLLILKAQQEINVRIIDEWKKNKLHKVDKDPTSFIEE